MRILLDTHVWLWMLAAPERLSPAARTQVEDPAITLLLSAASSWEIAIKWGLGKLDLPEPPERYVPDRLRSSGVTALPVEHSHVLRVAELPRHHRDPFDRVLIGAALVEGVPIMSADRAFDPYPVERLAAY
ncbi:MAG: type II toxin-antitoxin system VapC family toxin [Sporichthyaceae bacterium]